MATAGQVRMWIRELVEWDPADVRKLEPTALGEGLRVLLEHTPRLLMAAEEDSTYSWFLLNSDSGLWQRGNEAVQSRRPTGELRELIARTNRDYRDELLGGAVAGTIKGLAGKGPEDRVQAIAPVLKALDRLATPRAALETAAAMTEVVINDDLRGAERLGVRTCKRVELDGDPRYLGAPNGVIDLRDGSLLSPASGADALVSASLPDPFDLAAQHPDVDRLLAHQDQALREWTITALARTLHGASGVKKAFFLVGERDGGKSTLLAAVQAALGGQYAQALGAGALAPQRQGGGATPDVKGVVAPTRFAVAPEAKNARIDVERFKALTGSDPQSWRPLYQSPRTQPPMAVLWLVGNELPLEWIAADGPAASRVWVVEYRSIPEHLRDVRMLRAFEGVSAEARARRQALVALLVRRAIELDPYQPLTPPDEVMASTDDWLAQARGDLGQWISEALEPHPGGKLYSRDLWAAALAASGGRDEAFGRPRRAVTEMARTLHGLGNQSVLRDADGKTARGWHNWRLTDEAAQTLLDADPKKGLFK